MSPACFFGPGVSIGDNVHILANSHIEGASISSGVPGLARSPGSGRGPRLGEDAHIGNFVKVKKAVIGRAAKANHLTYIGDAKVGAGSNIGAGTITCNYDGFEKHFTDIGSQVFVGSNTPWWRRSKLAMAQILLREALSLGTCQPIFLPSPR